MRARRSNAPIAMNPGRRIRKAGKPSTAALPPPYHVVKNRKDPTATKVIGKTCHPTIIPVCHRHKREKREWDAQRACRINHAMCRSVTEQVKLDDADQQPIRSLLPRAGFHFIQLYSGMSSLSRNNRIPPSSVIAAPRARIAAAWGSNLPETSCCRSPAPNACLGIRFQPP